MLNAINWDGHRMQHKEKCEKPENQQTKSPQSPRKLKPLNRNRRHRSCQARNHWWWIAPAAPWRWCCCCVAPSGTATAIAAATGASPRNPSPSRPLPHPPPSLPNPTYRPIYWFPSPPLGTSDEGPSRPPTARAVNGGPRIIGFPSSRSLSLAFAPPFLW